MSNLRSAYVDLSAIRDNVKVLQDYAKNSEVMAVVKADAYGHGLIKFQKQHDKVELRGLALHF